jgi:hypothetical protein
VEGIYLAEQVVEFVRARVPGGVKR